MVQHLEVGTLPRLEDSDFNKATMTLTVAIPDTLIQGLEWNKASLTLLFQLFLPNILQQPTLLWVGNRHFKD